MSEYRISLTDIKGVGPTTAERVRDRLESYTDDGESIINALHLLRTRGSPAWNDLHDDGVNRDSLEHLSAVGEAVHYTGTGRVKAKHLTGELVENAEFSSSFVQIEADDPEPDPEPEAPEAPKVAGIDVDAALETVRGEYGDGYPEWGRFLADYVRHLRDELEYDVDVSEPDHAMPVVRWRQYDAKELAHDDNWEDEHLHALVSFAETL